MKYARNCILQKWKDKCEDIQKFKSGLLFWGSMIKTIEPNSIQLYYEVLNMFGMTTYSNTEISNINNTLKDIIVPFSLCVPDPLYTLKFTLSNGVPIKPKTFVFLCKAIGMWPEQLVVEDFLDITNCEVSSVKEKVSNLSSILENIGVEGDFSTLCSNLVKSLKNMELDILTIEKYNQQFGELGFQLNILDMRIQINTEKIYRLNIRDTNKNTIVESKFIEKRYIKGKSNIFIKNIKEI